MSELYPITFRKVKRTGLIIAVQLDDASGKIHGNVLYDGFDGRGRSKFGAGFIWQDTVRASPKEYAKLAARLNAWGWHFVATPYSKWFVQFRRDVFYGTPRGARLYAKTR